MSNIDMKDVKWAVGQIRNVNLGITYLKILTFKVFKTVRLGITLGNHAISKAVRTKTEPKGILICKSQVLMKSLREIINETGGKR